MENCLKHHLHQGYNYQLFKLLVNLTNILLIDHLVCLWSVKKFWKMPIIVAKVLSSNCSFCQTDCPKPMTYLIYNHIANICCCFFVSESVIFHHYHFYIVGPSTNNKEQGLKNRLSQMVFLHSFPHKPSFSVSSHKNVSTSLSHRSCQSFF